MASRRSDQLLERLTRLHPKIIDLSLGRIERLLARLGHPERALPPVVHVAGTNGKGSVIAFLRAILEAGGRRVQVYSSPHLVRFHERIRLSGGLIEEPALAALLEECEGANGEAPITFFEITTAAAFLAFSRDQADVLLLEVGLGGRLDATNVVERPLLSILTPIAMDHMQYLGDELATIAFEKAGILKAGVPAVVGIQDPRAATVIESQAEALGLELWRQGLEWRVAPQDGGFLYRGLDKTLALPAPALPGRHQLDNAGTAVTAALLLAEPLGLSEAHLAEGLRRAEWPARMQHLVRGPLVERLPEGWELWLDGGHNAHAGQALAANLAAWSDRPLHLIYGMMNTKAAAGFLEPLASLARDLHAVAIPGEAASLSAEQAAAFARGAGFRVTASASVEAAVADILERHKTPARILICGSLYLAGSVLEDHG